MSMTLYGLIAEFVFSAARPLLDRKYSEGNDDRYGYFKRELPKGALWVHAVSVGEVQSAYPFVRALKAGAPSLDVLLSTITQTGHAMAGQLMGDLVERIYYPWDAPSILKRALDALQPKAYVTMETEIWPEMLRQLERRKIPAFLVNGRLSESSFERYARFRKFWGRVIRRYSLLMVKSEVEKERFIELGALPERVRVTGDCKVDALIARRQAADLSDLAPLFRGDRPAILAGSTHEGEEEVVFEAFAKLRKKYPSLRLVVAPRHPERAPEVAALADESAFGEVALMSEAGPDWNVLVIDRIGVLFSLYGCIKAAFLGGSLVPRGGQNIMEPAIWGIPFCQGPDFRDFLEATQALSEVGVGQIVHDASEMVHFFDDVLSSNVASECYDKCRRFFATHGGASERSWKLIQNLL